MTFVLDTSVVSELRKPARRIDARVQAWARGQAVHDLFISAVTVLEVEIGVARAERRDAVQGAHARAQGRVGGRPTVMSPERTQAAVTMRAEGKTTRHIAAVLGGGEHRAPRADGRGRGVSKRRELAARLDRLQELSDRLPTLACQGLCASSCEQHVGASDAEAQMVAKLGVDLAAPTATGACPALRTNPFGQQRCSVHQARPMICRLWGVAEAMPCPHGCVAGAAPLSDINTLEALLDSLSAGGSDEDVEGMPGCCGERPPIRTPRSCWPVSCAGTAPAQPRWHGS